MRQQEKAKVEDKQRRSEKENRRQARRKIENR